MVKTKELNTTQQDTRNYSSFQEAIRVKHFDKKDTLFFTPKAAAIMQSIDYQFLENASLGNRDTLTINGKEYIPVLKDHIANANASDTSESVLSWVDYALLSFFKNAQKHAKAGRWLKAFAAGGTGAVVAIPAVAITFLIAIGKGLKNQFIDPIMREFLRSRDD